MSRSVLIMAGGTGGHVFPALAVAECLKEKGITVEWLGTKKGIESRVVIEAGYKMHWLSISGLRGKNKLSLIFAPLKLTRACLQALWVMLKVKPSVVLGMGGFVSGPGGLMAYVCRRPLVVHEQNAIPGLTNTLLSKIAGTVMESFPESFAINKPVELVGNPVRAGIMRINEPSQRLENRKNGLNILVVGGSLGAAVLNKTVPEMLSISKKDLSVKVWHQTGKNNYQNTVDSYEKYKVDGRIDAFIEDMAEAYEWADVVICRAGAMTVSELAVAGVASILVPYPYAVDDHQTANAKYLVESDAAILIPQSELTAESLNKVICTLSREKIIELSIAARQCAKPNATETVAELCMKAGGLA